MDIDTVELHTGQYYMGQILDFCISDSIIYIADMSNAVWAFKYPSGTFINRIQKIGHGNGEYVSLRAVTAKDNIVYLLDIGESKVLLYDSNLNYKKSIRLDFHAIDFAKNHNGFLFCNATATEDLHRLVYTDEKGKVVNSFLPNKMELDLLSGDRTFTEDKDGQVFFNSPYSDDIYKWTKEEKPTLLYQMDYDRKRLEESVKKSSEIAESDDAYNATFFIIDKKCVNSFIKDHIRYYSFYDPDKNNNLHGFVDTTECIPFYPTGQYEDALVSIYHTGDLDKWKPQKDSCDAALFIFHLK